MSAVHVHELTARVRGSVAFEEPLARYTTYRIGGRAAALVSPTSVDDVISTLAFCAETGSPWLVLGLGSNVLIADAGIEGVVIRLGKGMDQVVRAAEDDRMWRVGAGLPTPRLARMSANRGWAGVHRLIGVPGTVGGGVAMNAGAHGQEFSQVVENVEVVSADGTVLEVPSHEISWQYRASGLHGVVTATSLVLRPGDTRDLQDDIRKHFRWRRAGTPFDEPCCGSVFRNPARSANGAAQTDPGTAGQLIDAASLKGFQIGGARVSHKHANYIVNVGDATATDVRKVIDHVRGEVLKQFGIELRLEVKIIG